MLQPAVLPQLARLNGRGKGIVRGFASFQTTAKKQKSYACTDYPGPMAFWHKKISKLLEMLGPEEKHWFVGGLRSSSVASQTLRKNEIIAVPTDTIYGFAALAQNPEAIAKLYALKGREKTKPVAITLGSVSEVSEWAEIDHLPPRLLNRLLPGPVTVVLKRKAKLNRALNPGHETVGVRVPSTKFLRHVSRTVGEPLALTSANLSNEPSSLHPDEFSSLWPKLGAIFYDIPKGRSRCESQRVGSTVVDLTVPGAFEILRPGIRYSRDLEILKTYFLESKIVENNEEEEKECRQESNG